nr:hypothetical protein Iba_chr04fCG7710 [Ipomoea batatas]
MKSSFSWTVVHSVRWAFAFSTMVLGETTRLFQTRSFRAYQMYQQIMAIKLPWNLSSRLQLKTNQSPMVSAPELEIGMLE